ncbi:MAG TPA: hypothetical protein VMV29_17710 [Ktedonobacterales bacterium]|nr:hypothetical protein [Ktedonobacterales bacterium]
MADNTIVPPSVPDVVSQAHDWVVGVIDNPADAEQAVQDLRNAGFAEDEIVLLHGPDAVRAFQTREAHQGPFRRFLSFIVGDTNDISGFARDYADEAGMGHSVISVYAPQAEDVAQAQQTIEAHGGHRVKHYGQWTVNHLSMQERDQHEPQAAPGLQAAADADAAQQAPLTSQPNTTSTTNAQTNLPNTVESASGWQDTPMPPDAETDDSQYPGEGI